MKAPFIFSRSHSILSFILAHRATYVVRAKHRASCSSPKTAHVGARPDTDIPFFACTFLPNTPPRPPNTTGKRFIRVAKAIAHNGGGRGRLRGGDTPAPHTHRPATQTPTPTTQSDSMTVPHSRRRRSRANKVASCGGNGQGGLVTGHRCPGRGGNANRQGKAGHPRWRRRHHRQGGKDHRCGGEAAPARIDYKERDAGVSGS